MKTLNQNAKPIQEYGRFLKAQRAFESARGRVILAYARADKLASMPPIDAHPEPHVFSAGFQTRADRKAGVFGKICRHFRKGL